MAAFDNWMDIDNVSGTFKHVGYGFNITPEEYYRDVHILMNARLKHPELPLFDALTQTKLEVPSKGFGDTLYKFIHKRLNPVAKLAEAYSDATNKDCGCSKRENTLNKLVPYGV